MLAVRQLSRSLQATLDFPQPREMLRESLCARVSGACWKMAFHRDFGARFVTYCRSVPGHNWLRVVGRRTCVSAGEKALCTPYRVIIR